jgi:hypothetical protein
MMTDTVLPRHLIEQQFFGKNAALQVSIEETAQGLPTIGFQMASSDNNKVDWQQSKIMFQLNPNTELVGITQMLLGKVSGTIDFKYHGADRNKSLRFQTRPDCTLYISLYHANRSHAISIGADQVFNILTLFVKALSKRHGISVTAAHELAMAAPFGYQALLQPLNAPARPFNT